MKKYYEMMIDGGGGIDWRKEYNNLQKVLEAERERSRGLAQAMNKIINMIPEEDNIEDPGQFIFDTEHIISVALSKYPTP